MYDLRPGLKYFSYSVSFAVKFEDNGRASQGALVVKNMPANAGNIMRGGFHPWVGRIPGGGHGNPL